MSFYPALILIVGMALLSLAFRTISHPVAQKLGLVCLLTTSFLIGYLPGRSWILGILCVSTWLLLPWLEILTRIRRLRLPADKTLSARRPPSRDLFPDLDHLTEEIEEDGFTYIDDAGWDWDNHSQFFRLFYREEDRLQGAICLIDQEQIAFFYLMISTRTSDGKLWTTWNYPFSSALKFAPAVTVRRVRAGLSFSEMLKAHQRLLDKKRVTLADVVPLTQEEMQASMQKELRAQLDHNLRAGVLTKTDEGKLRYSWRGLFYIWCQFLRDVVRL